MKCSNTTLKLLKYLNSMATRMQVLKTMLQCVALRVSNVDMFKGRLFQMSVIVNNDFQREMSKRASFLLPQISLVISATV